MKEFVKYYFDRPLRDDGYGKMWWTLNYTWLLGSLLFIGLFLYGEAKYHAPIFYFMAMIPALMLVYNIIDEYNAYICSKTGARNASAGKLMYIFYGASALILVTIILILLFL
jgi:hypothetical protein